MGEGEWGCTKHWTELPGRTAIPMQSQVHGRAYRPELLMQPEDIATGVINVINLLRCADLADIPINPSRNRS
jgi:hypothetical protein